VDGVGAGFVKQIFVYGTLMHDGVNADLLSRRRDARYLGPARCRGVLYDLGEYPALVIEGKAWVAGELYRCDAIEEIVRNLDPLESEAGFDRLLLAVTWKLGETEAWTYVHPSAPPGAPRIPGGSYKARLRDLKRAGGRD
jgi:gamma-glutamylcyclotransferase (GGCT)/AIG2-like uncharacterized protein YtfP